MNKTLYVDCELLSEKIKESGLKINYLCENLGISRAGFWKKVKGETPFRVPEVFVLCSLLKIENEDKMKIFYPKEQPVS